MSKCYNYNCSKNYPAFSGRSAAQNTDQEAGDFSSGQKKHGTDFSSFPLCVFQGLSKRTMKPATPGVLALLFTS